MRKFFGVVVLGFSVLIFKAVFPAVGTAESASHVIVAAQYAVRDRLFDPDSAQFKDMTVTGAKDHRMVCGMVNAKNKFGGYVGYKPFIYQSSTGLFDIANGGGDLEELTIIAFIEKECSRAKQEETLITPPAAPAPP